MQVNQSHTYDTVEDLRKQVHPYGFIHPGGQTWKYNGQLCIDNLFVSKASSSPQTTPSKHLELIHPVTKPAAGLTTCVRPVTIYDQSDRICSPKTYGVSVSPDATLCEMMPILEDMAGISGKHTVYCVLENAHQDNPR